MVVFKSEELHFQRFKNEETGGDKKREDRLIIHGNEKFGVLNMKTVKLTKHGENK
mgnify:CR=1 FL=1